MAQYGYDEPIKFVPILLSEGLRTPALVLMKSGPGRRGGRDARWTRIGWLDVSCTMPTTKKGVDRLLHHDQMKSSLPSA